MRARSSSSRRRYRSRRVAWASMLRSRRSNGPSCLRRSRQAVRGDVVKGLKEVEGPMKDRHAMSVGLLRQDAKPLTAGVLLASALRGEKIVQLKVGVGEFLGLFRPFKETGAMTGERQLFNFAAFVLGPQRTKLSHILHDQCVATPNVAAYPRRSPA